MMLKTWTSRHQKGGPGVSQERTIRLMKSRVEPRMDKILATVSLQISFHGYVYEESRSSGRSPHGDVRVRTAATNHWSKEIHDASRFLERCECRGSGSQSNWLACHWKWNRGSMHTNWCADVLLCTSRRLLWMVVPWPRAAYTCPLWSLFAQMATDCCTT